MCSMLIWQGYPQVMAYKRNVNHILKSKKPGDVVLIDQLTVTTPDLIGQVTRFLTHSRYHYKTEFLDHYSDFPYIMLQISSTGD